MPLLRLRSDDQLVALFRAGHDEAFAVIHDRYRQRLFAYTRQMLGGSRQDAEDALQDVFLRAYSGLRTNGRPISLKAWLYRVAHNRCVDQLRRPQASPAELFETTRGALHDPLEIAERREDLRRLVADIQRLPEQQRSVLLMREIEGTSYAELADTHDVTVAAVKSLLVRARMGLVEAGEARATACEEVREDLCLSFDRGVRASGLARRHLRDCGACRDYRAALRTSRQRLGALLPIGAGPVAALLQLFGGGGAGGAAAGGTAALTGGTTTAAVGTGGAAAIGGGAAAGGTGIAIGGATAAATATKVAAVVASAVVVAGGGAVEVTKQLAPAQHHPAPAAVGKPGSGAAAAPATKQRAVAVPKLERRPVEPVLTAPPLEAPADPTSAIDPLAGSQSGGADHGDSASGGAGALDGDPAAGTGGALAPPEEPADDSAALPGTTLADASPGNVEPVTSPATGAPPTDVAATPGHGQADQASSSPTAGSPPAPGSGGH
jgi:RNA polymerase sigma factor (sigma-70 family)